MIPIVLINDDNQYEQGKYACQPERTSSKIMMSPQVADTADGVDA